MKELYQELEFLRESNNIEHVRDDDALEQAILAWHYIKNEDRLTTSSVLKTHKILMLHKLVGNRKGYLRQETVWIAGREGKPWFALPELVENWCEDMNDLTTGARNATKDEERVKELHVRYEEIHPFVDGNGRTGRIFMNWLRIKLGMLILVIKESEKQEYYKWFN